MKLWVDIGNTNIKWQWGPDVHSDAGASWQQLIARWARLQPQAIYVSCVKSPAWQQVFAEACAKTTGVAPMFAKVSPGVIGPRLAYHQPAALGVDRWLGMAALWATVPDSFVLVSAGSAVTVDYVDRNKGHLGGQIIPGVGMSLHALDRGTGRIGSQAVGLSTHWLPGATTSACVEAGLTALYSGFLRQICEHPLIRAESGVLVLTGGDAQVLLPLLGNARKALVYPFVVLEGLRYLFDPP